MELGIYTFVEATKNPTTGIKYGDAQRMKNLLEEIELADSLGLDVFAIGEHHRKEFLVSSPAVVLAAAAVKTKNIRLSSAVTVLSSDDPVRVFQDFATVDLLSEGRAEIMAGRGSFIESFPLFGFDLNDYDSLFSEKLDLLIKLNKSERVTWSGKHRPSFNNLGIYPRPHQKEIPIWIAVGGTPESAVRAGRLGLPLALAIIGGSPQNFVPLTQLYKNSFLENGHDPSQLQLGINSHVFVADTSEEAAEIFYPPYADLMTTIGKERGWSGMTKAQFEMMRTKNGSLLVGSPDEVAEKIIYEYELFGNTRFLAQMSVGTIPHEKMLRSIELFGKVVAPKVREYVKMKK